MSAAYNVILNIIEDFEEFIGKLERRREELEDFKDELLIYSDLEFMESIRRGVEEAENCETVKCENESEMDKLFKFF
ncbi:hypothetical protein C4E24_06505 [ANME-1 cluster archaeon AG-394-G21]|nr:hypothetical protein [ANME-1 cluster archaeon AG-394-G21]